MYELSINNAARERFQDYSLSELNSALDADQQRLVSLIERGRGPYLLRGSAGTGKTSVLIHGLFAATRYRPLLRNSRILYVTYTNALAVTAGNQIARLSRPSNPLIDVRTAYSIVSEIIRSGPGNEEQLDIKDHDNPDLSNQLEAAIGDYENIVSDGLRKMVAVLVRRGMTTEYLLGEIEEVLVANNFQSVFSYYDHTRSRKKFRLSRPERAIVWNIARSFEQRLESRRWTTWPRRARTARQIVENNDHSIPNYDAIFIDEAQDLPPNIIHLLVELCRSDDDNVERLFLSTDADQTIYGSGQAWIGVHPDLQLTGRSQILRKNYRCTPEIAEAAKAYFSGAELEDERPTSEYVFSGPVPVFIHVLDRREELDTIATFLRSSTQMIGRGLDVCAVLVPSHERGRQIARGLVASGIAAEFMLRKDVDLNFEGVKVLTLHSAKGLGFPIVAVCLATQADHRVSDPNEQQELFDYLKRLNHMGMTRSLHALLVTLPATHRPERFAGVAPPLWQQGRPQN